MINFLTDGSDKPVDLLADVEFITCRCILECTINVGNDCSKRDGEK